MGEESIHIENEGKTEKLFQVSRLKIVTTNIMNWIFSHEGHYRTISKLSVMSED
jgi:hypothetical protein